VFGIRDLEDAALCVIEYEDLEVAVSVISPIYRLLGGDVGI
jgi:hypothetical protein